MPLSKKKSCARCRRSKLRCNLEAPCSQCAKKRLDCSYDERTPPLHLSRVYSQAENFAVPEIFSIPPEPMLDIGASLPIEWDLPEPIRYADLSTPKSFSGRHGNLFQPESLSFDLSDNGANMALETPSPGPDTQLVSTQFTRTLERRGFLRGCVLTSVVLGQLTGFPKMMIEGDALPPFIQPPCCSDEEQASECRTSGRHRCLPEILAICASLVGMFYSRTPANQDFVWKSIYAEGQRLWDNVRMAPQCVAC